MTDEELETQLKAFIAEEFKHPREEDFLELETQIRRFLEQKK